MTRRGALLALALVIFFAAGLVAGWRRRATPSATTNAPTAPAGARAPQGVRVRVEVLNATKTRGLARRATLFLRDRGFDVVGTGTEATSRDTTLVVDLSGHPDWAQRVARALGTARVESHPDSSRDLDVSVLLGATWRPPAQPFYP
jgi:hypothetical protein